MADGGSGQTVVRSGGPGTDRRRVQFEDGTDRDPFWLPLRRWALAIGDNNVGFHRGIDEKGVHPDGFGDDDGVGRLAEKMAHDGDLGFLLKGRAHGLGKDDIRDRVAGDGVVAGVGNDVGFHAALEAEPVDDRLGGLDRDGVQVENGEADLSRVGRPS